MSQSDIQGYLALMYALRSSTVESAMSGAVNIIIAISPNSPADKWCAEFFVDFPDFLYAIDIRLINAFDPAATAVIASGAEFAVYSACAPESLMNNADSFFQCGIFDQDGGHYHTSPFTVRL
jgi:hypothetical protein